MDPRFVAVIDIGKTNAKVALADLEAMTEVAVEKTPNSVLPGPPYPHFDTERLFTFIVDGLAKLAKTHRIDAISITTHGATAALTDENGTLALPVLDYEHDGPDSVRAQYETIRPSFAETGSPPLPVGLNLGAQIFWQAQAFPQAFARVRHILMYPQYWAMRLTGIAASEVTSLGCHTDLWNPHQGDFSWLVGKVDAESGSAWRPLFPPMRAAHEVLGPLKPELAARMGLRNSIPVLTGIHDSNASLLPWLGLPEKSFSVVSTGTWIISMAIGGRRVELDPARDTLINVNALGGPVPTARFMGGREFERIVQGARSASNEEASAVLSGKVMLLPSVENGSGPFAGRRHEWVGRDPASEGERFAATSFYCALMTATCLNLIGAEGPVIVEGPFGANRHYLDMLGAATKSPVLTSVSSTGTAMGAALLAATARKQPAAMIMPEADPEYTEACKAYAALWLSKAAG